jgi:hypothetical protein
MHDEHADPSATHDMSMPAAAASAAATARH